MLDIKCSILSVRNWIFDIKTLKISKLKSYLTPIYFNNIT